MTDSRSVRIDDWSGRRRDRVVIIMYNCDKIIRIIKVIISKDNFRIHSISSYAEQINSIASRVISATWRTIFLLKSTLLFTENLNIVNNIVRFANNKMRDNRISKDVHSFRALPPNWKNMHTRQSFNNCCFIL